MNCSIYGQQTAVVKLDAFSWLNGYYGGGVDVCLTERIVIGADASLVRRSRGDGIVSAETVERGILIAPRVQYYIATTYDKAPKGLYVGANYIYENLNVDINRYDDDLQTIDSLSVIGGVRNSGIGAFIGYQWIFRERFAIDVRLNPYLNTSSLSGDLLAQPAAYEDRNGLRIDRLFLGFGIAF